MAGHSKFKKIKHKKGANDSQKAQDFTKKLRTIFMAAKAGLPDPNLNLKLRIAIKDAQSISVPKDKIEQAIAKAANKNDGENMIEIRYNASMDGVMFIIEAATNNRNRTASEVRSIIVKNGGTLLETGQVEFLFENNGLISYPKTNISLDTVFEEAINAGAKNIEEEGEMIYIETQYDQLKQVTEALSHKFGDPQQTNLYWKAIEDIRVEDSAKLMKIQKVIDLLDELEDVTEVYINADLSNLETDLS